MIGYVPQSEDVDWTFPVSVRDVVMMGRYGRQGITAASAGGEQARRSTRRWSESSSPSTPTARSGSSPAGSASAPSSPAASPRGGARRILLLDEPFAGVDKRSEATIVAASARARGSGQHDARLDPRPARPARRSPTRRCCCMRRVLFHGSGRRGARTRTISRHGRSGWSGRMRRMSCSTGFSSRCSTTSWCARSSRPWSPRSCARCSRAGSCWSAGL